MTDKELVIDLNKIPYADVLRFSSKDIDFCNNSLHILILFPNSIEAVYNIYAEKYIVDSKRGSSKYFDLPLNTDKDKAIVFISSSTNCKSSD